jgi:hypothetical protein
MTSKPEEQVSNQRGSEKPARILRVVPRDESDQPDTRQNTAHEAGSSRNMPPPSDGDDDPGPTAA